MAHLHHMRRIIVVVAGALWLAGCASETTNPTENGGGTVPVDVPGVWNGTWFQGSLSGYVSLSVEQRGDSIFGVISNGAPCVTRGSVEGLVAGDSVFLVGTSGPDSVLFAATFRGQSIDGIFSGHSGGCAGASGLFTLQKQGAFIETVASPIQFIPSIYSTAYPFRAHMAAGPSGVFWYEGEAKALRKAPTTGGAAQTLATGFTSDFAPIVVDESHVYVADSLTIKRVPINGGAAESLAQADFYIMDIATDSVYVYWIDNESFAQIMRVPVGGGAVETLGAGDRAGRMCVVGGYVYWMSHDDTILRVSTSGGAVETVAGNLPFLANIACDGEFVFFSEQDTGQIRKVPVGGGAITTVVFGSSMWSPYVLAVNDAALFWINQAEVAMIPKAGGEKQLIVFNLLIDPFFPEAVAVDGNMIYWTEAINGAIRRAELK